MLTYLPRLTLFGLLLLANSAGHHAIGQHLNKEVEDTLIRSHGQYDMSVYPSGNEKTMPVRPAIRGYGIGFQGGFVFAHAFDVQNTKGAHPLGAEIIYSWQFNDQRNWDICGCMPQHSLSIGYYGYDTPVLGKGLLASYSLEPWYPLGEGLHFAFRMRAGLAYLSNPHHPEENPDNQSYSTNVSGYLTLGAGLWIRLSEHLLLNPSLIYQHLSNGGVKLPNRGVNFPTAGVAVQYRPEPLPLRSFIQERIDWRGAPLRWDIGFFNAVRSIYPAVYSDEVGFISGLAFQVAKRVGKINSLTGGVEINYDDSAHERILNFGYDADPWAGSILLGHEFLLGKFLFSQRLGVYLHRPIPEVDRIYHRWGLNFQLTGHWALGIHLLAHRQVAYYTDFRVVYSL